MKASFGWLLGPTVVAHPRRATATGILAPTATGCGAGTLVPMNRTSSGTATPVAHQHCREPRLPIEPLEYVVTRRSGWSAVVSASGMEPGPELMRLTRTFFRARLRGWVSLADADQMAVRLLGLHPCLVWGSGWWDALEQAA